MPESVEIPAPVSTAKRVIPRDQPVRLGNTIQDGDLRFRSTAPGWSGGDIVLVGQSTEDLFPAASLDTSRRASTVTEAHRQRTRKQTLEKITQG